MSRIQNITKIINSIDQYDISGLKIKTKKANLLINKKQKHSKFNKKVIKASANSTTKKETIHREELTVDNKNVTIDREKDKLTKISSIYSTIISPMVGTFYRSPAPNENVFVEIGESIKQKQIVCIIEAMKLMNEIESEVRGEIVEILVKDGEIVDCGQALMKVKIK
uniref:Biotin carboxyl carrier protein of acetyl-CoA carboxylase n=1 Tax=Polysiphonia sertularioides TaxID=945028 RepID=A0A1Z1MGX9_9FLOR|nr:acetyl-CoA carboxylase biotin carboxyl carrier protein [Polysiphonia sertularioides]